MNIVFFLVFVFFISSGLYFYLKNNKHKESIELRKNNFIVRKTKNTDQDQEFFNTKKNISSRIQKKLKNKKYEKTRLRFFQVLLGKSGLKIELSQFLLYATLVGLVVFLILWLTTNFFFGLIGFGFGFLILPSLYLKYLSNKRQKNFSSNFMIALETIVRGLKSGLPIEECFRIIEKQAKSPVKEEFELMNADLKNGFSFTETLNRSYQRMPIEEYSFFIISLTIQSETGGNLSEILLNNSNLIRGKMIFKEKLDTATAEPKMIIKVLVALPVGILAILYFVGKKYVAVYYQTTIGELIFSACVISIFIGVFIINSITKIKV